MNHVGQIITERLLPCVQAPGQYVGLETNARCGDVQAAEVKVALAFPDAYTIGISNFGSQVLYDMLNDIPHVACDRAYCPQADAEQIMRQEHIPLFGWESRCALGDFDVVGFSLTYELCATNVLTMLDLAGIPLLAAERKRGDPVIVGGDALADSPEPLADFFDVFLPGDGEAPLRALVQLLRDTNRSSTPREEILLRIAREVPSAYVPRFYSPARGGYPAGVAATRDDVPATISRACLMDFADSPPPASPLVPLFEAVHERVVIEIMRGCPNACRFCQAGYLRLPVRRRSVEQIIQTARAAIEASGYREISLLSLSSSDFGRLDELIEALNAEFADKHISVSLPSLRVDSRLRILPKLTSVVRKGGLTIAAEAGSARLRAAIGKNITEADMLAGVRSAWEAGFSGVKVYFMAGLPGERDEDIDAIFDLCLRLSDTRRKVDGRRGAITAAVSWLVPKPHTPMQWEPMRPAEYFFEVMYRLKDLARRSPITFRFHRIEQSLLEALLCRGDRSVGRAILAAWRNGARMDSWREHWNWETWRQAIEQAGVDFNAIVHTALRAEGPGCDELPWSHITPHLGVEHLLRQRRRMTEALESPTGD